MSKNVVILIVVLLAIVAGVFYLEKPKEGIVCADGDTGVYSLSFSDDKGRCRALGEFKAPVVVINSWASWCPFCVEELPDLGRIAEEFPEVPVVIINRSESSTDANTFLKTLDVSKKVVRLFDPEDSFYKFIEGFGMPETIFIDESGATIFHKRGVMSYEEMESIIKQLTSRIQPNLETYNNLACLGDGEACRVN
ncbi:hypothetical protein COB52_00875 [Candidatus Kaiserbacteria bacterium]|nr:MAG: hypothetical protein COB52_00875 [Candidatus Kaiserbacteria bacterium]